MTLAYPDFRLDRPNLNPRHTDAFWWFILRLEELSERDNAQMVFAGGYTNKPGFHNTRENLRAMGLDDGALDLDTDYSMRDPINRLGPEDKAAGIDWTSNRAHSGNYVDMKRYTNRVINSGRDPDDPRVQMILFEILGNTDNDGTAEGWDFLHDHIRHPDSTHAWHMHFSFLRKFVGDFWAYWALLTVLMGWSVQRWRDSLEVDMDLTAQNLADIAKAVWTHTVVSPSVGPVGAGQAPVGHTFTLAALGNYRIGEPVPAAEQFLAKFNGLIATANATSEKVTLALARLGELSEISDDVDALQAQASDIDAANDAERAAQVAAAEATIAALQADLDATQVQIGEVQQTLNDMANNPETLAEMLHGAMTPEAWATFKANVEVLENPSP